MPVHGRIMEIEKAHSGLSARLRSGTGGAWDEMVVDSSPSVKLGAQKNVGKKETTKTLGELMLHHG